MAELKFKTRGKSTPQGKQKVYFSCHPEDFSKYFDMVSKDILDKQNCAIWYDEEPNRPWDEQLAFDLEQMQLFVMPVTKQLLRTDNRAISKELPFAKEHHIPVLPLLMDATVEKEFNAVFGNVQWLNPFDTDETAISYEKKLETFLNGVLIGDELAEKIRKEFDAYIFFSYRKKDRKYATDVMKKVHDKDACRDIAIWYDEYLIPGENFDENILTALSKSDIFLLMVTPNLINEKNYVKDQEYPEALRQGESILPIEVEATDKEAFYKIFTDVPDTIDSEDGVAMNAAMQELLQENSIVQHEDTPEHIYYMGMAYLGGIDVEVDHKRAVKLLMESAEAGHVEAMKKLANMYQNGEAVERNYRMSVIWLQKMIEVLKLKYQETKVKEDGLRLIDEMRYLCYILRKEILDIEGAKQLLCECAKLARELDGELAKWSLMSVYRDLGYVEHNLDSKRDLYLEALKLAEELQGEACEWNHKDSLADCCDDLGNVYSKKREYKYALEYYQLALRTYLENTSEGPSHRYNLASAYLKVAQCLIDMEKGYEALSYLESGFEEADSVVDERGTVADYLIYASYLIAYSKVYEKEDPGRAKRLLVQAESLAKQKLTTEPSMETEGFYAHVCHNLAMFFGRNGDEEAYLAYVKKDLEILGKQISYDNHVDCEFEQAMEYLKQAIENDKDGDEEDAAWFYERMTELLHKATENPKHAEYYSIVVKHLYAYACEYMYASEFIKSREYFKRVIWFCEKLLALEETEEYLIILGNAYRARARLEQVIGELEQAPLYYEKSLEVMTSANASPDVKAYICMEVATACWGIMDYKKGYKHYEQAESLYMQIATEQVKVHQGLTPDLRLMCLKQIVLCNCRMAEVHVMDEEYKTAITMLKSVEELAYSIADATQTETDYSDLWNLLRQIYETMEEAGDVEGAKVYREAANKIYDMLWGT